MHRSTTLSVTRLLQILLLVWITLLSASVLQDLARWAAVTDDRVWRLDVDFEGSVYTWFSGMLLLLVGLVSLAIAARALAERDTWRFHWLGLGLVFLILSMDETLSLHEQLSGAMATGEQEESWLYFRWVVPVGLGVLAFAVSYLRFLANLPRQIAVLMVVSGALFVGGAIGMEILAGKLVSGGGEAIYDGIAYRLLTNVEEGLEVAGVLLFLHTLFRYCLVTGFDRLELNERTQRSHAYVGTPAE
ncbi:hypothetical protein [Rhodobacter sp. NSM]|uniref:hypothetical protein n=1 Tax=Rhodobacter sp. NSM TaxID=3457501 RepID=UPI003FD3F343